MFQKRFEPELVRRQDTNSVVSANSRDEKLYITGYKLDYSFCMQDSYALCRVFKKNGVCTEIEEQQGQSSLSLLDYSQGAVNDYETMSPDVPLASSTSCMEEEDKEDKDDSWMQFITDDAWCSSTAPFVGQEEVSQVAFTN